MRSLCGAGGRLSDSLRLRGLMTHEHVWRCMVGYGQGRAPFDAIARRASLPAVPVRPCLRTYWHRAG